MCGDNHPVDERGSIARPKQVDVVLICHGLLLQHLLDQLQDEGDVVRLALLVRHVPAFLIAAWGNYNCTLAEIIQSIQVA